MGDLSVRCWAGAFGVGSFVALVVALPLIMIGVLVFLVGLRHVIRQAREEYEWLAALMGRTTIQEIIQRDRVADMETLADSDEAVAAPRRRFSA